MSEDKIITKQQRSSIIVGVCTAFITSFSGSALNLAIPSMGNYFHMGAVSISWIVTIYMLIVAAFAVPLGKVADSTGRKRVLIIGVSIFGVASVVAIFMPNAALMLTMRGIMAIGAAMIFATNMPIAISLHPKEERGKVIGLVTTGTYVGLALGPVMGGILNNYFGWKSIFLFGAFVSLVAFVVSIVGLRESKVDKDEMSLDLPGTLFYVLMISLLIYGLTVFNTYRFGWVFIIGFVVAGVLFVIRELKTEKPMMDVSIFARDKIFAVSNIVALLNYSATFALGYLVSIYLQVIMGFSSKTAGIILIAQPIFMAVLTPITGRLSDKVAAYKLAIIGMAFCTLSLGLFIFVDEGTSLFVIIVALCLGGIGVAFFSSPNTNIIMSRVKPSKFSMANSIVSTMRTTGQSTSMAIITIVVSATVGNVSLYEISSGDLVRTINIAFIIFSVLCLIGMLMSFQKKKK